MMDSRWSSSTTFRETQKRVTAQATFTIVRNLGTDVYRYMKSQKRFLKLYETRSQATVSLDLHAASVFQVYPG